MAISLPILLIIIGIVLALLVSWALGVIVFQDITQHKLMEPGHGQIVQQTETETSFVAEEISDEIPDVFVSDVKSPANPDDEKAA